MATAQQLYEGVAIDGETVGLITCMRTDSVTVAESAQQEAHAFIVERIGEAHAPAKLRAFPGLRRTDAQGSSDSAIQAGFWLRTRVPTADVGSADTPGERFLRHGSD